jgi:hypothetical protein
MRGDAHPTFDPALLHETYVINDPCEAGPLGEECQVFTDARGPGFLHMDYINFEVAEVDDPCQVADAPFTCDNDGETEKRIAAIYSNDEPVVV